MNVALYTAIYGPYERTVRRARVSCPAYFYTDTQAMADAAAAAGWQPRIVPHSVTTLNGAIATVEPMLNHKWWKTHPELGCPGADVSLWIDGSMEILVDDYVERCLALLGEDDWAMMPHPERDCALLEAEYSAVLHWRYDPPTLLRQLAHYRDVVGHPPHWGLPASGRNVRRHTPEVLAMCADWWGHNLEWSHQDQVSLPVLMREYEGKVRFNYRLPWYDGTVGLHEHGT